MDALQEAKASLEVAAHYCDNGRTEMTTAISQMSIAYALIALVERLDRMTLVPDNPDYKSELCVSAGINQP